MKITMLETALYRELAETKDWNGGAGRTRGNSSFHFNHLILGGIMLIG
jgi:hypothetical protein